MKTLDLLCKFVNSRPGLDFANYGDYKSYNAESREITRDRSDFYELLRLALWRMDRAELEARVTEYLTKSSGRLTLNGDRLEYCTGQYYPTEYRPAACRVLRDIIWSSYRDEKDTNGQPVYADGHAIRRAVGRNVSRRVSRLYFN